MRYKQFIEFISEAIIDERLLWENWRSKYIDETAKFKNGKEGCIEALQASEKNGFIRVNGTAEQKIKIIEKLCREAEVKKSSNTYYSILEHGEKLGYIENIIESVETEVNHIADEIQRKMKKKLREKEMINYIKHIEKLLNKLEFKGRLNPRKDDIIPVLKKSGRFVIYEVASWDPVAYVVYDDLFGIYYKTQDYETARNIVDLIIARDKLQDKFYGLGPSAFESKNAKGDAKNVGTEERGK